MILNKIIGRNISILYRNESIYIDKQTNKYNLSKIQVEVLLFVRDFPNSTLKEINCFFKFNKATVTKIIKYLAENGFVTISQNKDDRREKFISITDKADKILPVIKDIFLKWEKIILENIPKENIEITRDVLAQMVENMSLIQEDR